MCLIVDALDKWKIHSRIHDKFVIKIKTSNNEYKYEDFEKECRYYTSDRKYVPGKWIKEILENKDNISSKDKLKNALDDLCGGCKKTNNRIINNDLGVIAYRDFKEVFRHLVIALNNGKGNLQQKYDEMIKVCEVCNENDLDNYFHSLIKEKKEYTYIIRYLKTCMENEIK